MAAHTHAGGQLEVELAKLTIMAYEDDSTRESCQNCSDAENFREQGQDRRQPEGIVSEWAEIQHR